MTSANYSLIIQIISVIILLIPFIGSGTLYDRRSKWYQRLKFRGWMLLVLGSTTVVLTYLKDQQDDLDKQRQKKLLESQQKLNDAKNNRIINDNTKVYYDQLLKLGLNKAQADSLIQIANQQNLKKEIAKLKEGQVKPATVDFFLSRDSITFGSDRLKFEMRVLGSKIRKVKMQWVVAVYTRGYLVLIKQPKSSFSIASIAPEISKTSSVTEGAYLIDMYVALIWGSYFDMATKKMEYYREFHKLNERTGEPGPTSDDEEKIFNNFFENKVPVKVNVGVPGEAVLYK